MTQRFPTRRHGPVLRTVIRAFHFYEQHQWKTALIVLAVAFICMLVGAEVVDRIDGFVP
jgi:uncharacterized membrane protein YfcA